MPELFTDIARYMPTLSHAELRVYLAWRLTNRSAWPTNAALVDATGLSRAAVIVAKQSLEGKGLVAPVQKIDPAPVQPLDPAPCPHDMGTMRGRRRGEVLIVCKACGEVLERLR